MGWLTCILTWMAVRQCLVCCGGWATDSDWRIGVTNSQFLVISLSKALYFSGIILQVHLKKCAKIVAMSP